MSHDGWMLYGANGYTGKLIAEEAQRRGKRPLLAGRSKEKIAPLAQSLDLPWRVFSLDDPTQTKTALQEVSLVLNCAGPFSATSQAMVQACLDTATHYLDITGEIDVLEAVQSQNEAAIKAGCTLLPGVGFDVVPSDCLAALLAQALPDADHLQLAFCGEGGVSPGTLKTMIEMLGDGGRIRRDGRICKVAAAYKRKQIPFSDHERWGMTIPWGDVCTAYYSTGIGNIEVFTAVPRATAIVTRCFNPFMGVMKLRAVQTWLKALVEKHVQGPEETVRLEGCTRLWGEVCNARGQSCSAVLDILEGYQFTLLASLAIVERVLEGNIPAGALTPSLALGADFVESLPGSQLRWLVR